LSRDEFYVALRLIAYAQNGIPPTEDSVEENIEVPFPQFKSDTPKRPSMNSMDGSYNLPPPQMMPSIADNLPDLNNLNVMALNQNADGSLLPGMDQHLKQKEFEKNQK
jgi:hypothetical protein